MRNTCTPTSPPEDSTALGIARELHKKFVAIATELQPLRSLAVYHGGMLPEGASPLPDDAVFRLDPPVLSKDYAVPVGGSVIGYFGQVLSPTHALVVNLDYRTYSGRGQPRREEFLKPARRAIVGPGQPNGTAPSSLFSRRRGCELTTRLAQGQRDDGGWFPHARRIGADAGADVLRHGRRCRAQGTTTNTRAPFFETETVLDERRRDRPETDCSAAAAVSGAALPFARVVHPELYDAQDWSAATARRTR